MCTVTDLFVCLFLNVRGGGRTVASRARHADVGVCVCELARRGGALEGDHNYGRGGHDRGHHLVLVRVLCPISFCLILRALGRGDDTKVTVGFGVGLQGHSV